MYTIIKKYINALAMLFLFVILLSCATSPAGEDTFYDYDYNNPYFSAWDNIWTREPDAGTVAVSDNGVFFIDHKGDKDWSFQQKHTITVEAGDVFKLEASVKADFISGYCGFSIILYDNKMRVLEWMYQGVFTDTGHDWKDMTGNLLIPEGVAFIRPRLLGAGKQQVYWKNISIQKIKSYPLTLLQEEKSWYIENTACMVTLESTGEITIYDKAANDSYRIESIGKNNMLFSINNESPQCLDIDFLTPSAQYAKAQMIIEEDGCLVLELKEVETGIDMFRFPGSFLSEINTTWIIPENQGLLIPADDPYFTISWAIPIHAGHSGLSMPFLALAKQKSSLLIMCETADDCLLEFIKPEAGKTSGFSFIWEPSFRTLGYPRRLRCKVIQGGNYVDVALAYREYAEKANKVVTLEQKREQNPHVDLLLGAVDLWYWENAGSWSISKNPKPFLDELENLGISRILWANSAPKDAVLAMNNSGLLTSRYDNYQDAWSPKTGISYLNTEGWPDDIIIKANGEMQIGWIHREGGHEYPGYVICSPRQVELARRRVPAELAEIPYNTRFIDTTTAVSLYECYHQDHPVTRSQDRSAKAALLEYMSKELDLITGSETGIDWAVPYVHYFEGMMSLAHYRLPDSGYDLTTYIEPDQDFMRFQVGPVYRIPLFELVYHDCVVSYWYWGDSSNRIPEVWDERDLFNILYGTPPLWIVDTGIWEKHKERFIQSYTNATQTALLTGYSRMIDHKFITGDHTVQYTAFSNNVKVWVNFGNTPYTLPDKTVLNPKGFYIQE